MTDRSAAPIAALSAPKLGNSPQQCDDSVEVAVWCEAQPPGDGDGVPGGVLVAAVADGASESLLSGAWARMLTDEAVRLVGSGADAPADELAETVSPRTIARIAGACSARWPGFLDEYVAGRERAGKPLKWYERPGIERGAHATLAVLALHRTPGAAAPGSAPDDVDAWSWTAAALGDSCVFHVRDGKLLAALPMTAAGQFDASPDLIGSREPDLGLIAARSHSQSGICESGDRIYLATDALSAWILAAADGGDAWEAGLPGPGRFAGWIEQRRAEGSLRNDDVALARIEVGPQLARRLAGDPRPASGPAPSGPGESEA